MKMSWGVRLLLATVVVVAAWGAKVPSGWAYLLPPEQLLEFVVRHTRKIHNFRLDLVIETYGDGKVVRRPAVIHAARPDRLRLESGGRGEDGAEIVLVGAGRRLQAAGGYRLEDTPHHQDIFAAPLLAASVADLRALLAAEGIDLTTVHLDRLDRMVAYVIGARRVETTGGQFWLDKERFLPLRLRSARATGGLDPEDIRYLAYKEVAPGIMMPTIIEFYRQGLLQTRFLIQRPQVNLMLSPDLFDFDALAAKFPPMPAPEPQLPPAGAELEQMRRYLENKYE